MEEEEEEEKQQQEKEKAEEEDREEFTEEEEFYNILFRASISTFGLSLYADASQRGGGGVHLL